MIRFFNVLFSKVSIRRAIWSEIEEDMGFFVRYWPGIFGFVSRYIVYKLLFKKVCFLPFIQPGVRFTYTKGISLGRNVAINSNCYFFGKGGIDIGDNVMIAPNCSIVAGSYSMEMGEPLFLRETKAEYIKIENDCWLGANVVVLGGVTLGEGSVVGANSVVKKNTAPFSINAGTPARQVGDRRLL